MLDVFSRYVTGWMVAMRESAELAKRFLQDSCTKQRILPCLVFKLDQKCQATFLRLLLT
jgi:transposase InsO family protein